PSLHSRHIDDSAGGSSSSKVLRVISREDIEHDLLFAFINGGARRESLRLQLEHGVVAAAELHQLGMRPQLDDSPMLEHADAVGVPHGGEPVGYEDGRALPRGGQDAVEDLRFTANVE